MAEAGANFNSRGIGLRAQKKLLSKMSSKRIAKVFIDETTGDLLDNLTLISRNYTGNKKESEKLTKDIIKVIVKIGILYRNDQLNAEELAMAERFKSKFRTMSMTIISFYEVDFSFDKNFISKILAECHAMLSALIRRHLTDKTKSRVDHVFNFYEDTEFLDAVFRRDSPHRGTLAKIVESLHQMMENETI